MLPGEHFWVKTRAESYGNEVRAITKSHNPDLLPKTAPVLMLDCKHNEKGEQPMVKKGIQNRIVHQQAA